MKGKSTPPEITQSHQPREKLPWEALYAAYEQGGCDDGGWMEETRRFHSFYCDYPDPIDPPITLDRLISTATALRPIFGEKKWIETKQGPKRATAVAAEEAYELLSDCVRLMRLADIKKERLAALKVAYDSQVKRYQGGGEVSG
jgi:hypothetical protein